MTDEDDRAVTAVVPAAGATSGTRASRFSPLERKAVIHETPDTIGEGARRTSGSGIAFVALVLDLSDRSRCEQIGPEMLVERRVTPP
jgi:hypothetical protein